MPIVSSPSGWGSTKRVAGPWYAQYDPDAEPVGSAAGPAPTKEAVAADAAKYIPGFTPRASGSPMDSFFGGGSSGGSAGSSASFGGSFGGKNPFATDAAAAKLRDEFARMRKRTQGGINEDLAARGIFSSGVGANLMSEAKTQLDLQEAAGLEDLFNRSAQQQMAFQMEQQRMAMDDARARASQGAQRFGNANENQASMEALGFSSPTGARFGGTVFTEPPRTSGGDDLRSSGATQTGSYATTKAGGEPVRAPGESFDAFNARWQSWFRNRAANKGLSADTAGMFSGGAETSYD